MASFSASATGTSTIQCRVSGLSTVDYDRRFDITCLETGQEVSFYRYSGESAAYSTTFRNLSSGTLYHFTVEAYNIDKSPSTLVWSSSASARTDSPTSSYTMTVAVYEGSTQFGSARSTTQDAGTAHSVARWVADAGFTASTLPDSNWEFDYATCNGVTYYDEIFTDVPLTGNSTLRVYYKLKASVYTMTIHTLLDGRQVDVKSGNYTRQTATVGTWINSLRDTKGLIIPDGYFDYATVGSSTGVVLGWNSTVALDSNVEMWARWDSTGPTKGPYIWATKGGITKFWPATAYIVPSGTSFRQSQSKIYSNGWKS